MTLPGLSLRIDTADTVRALDAAFRRSVGVERMQRRLHLGRVLGRAESVLARTTKPAVRARWQPIADAARDAIEGWRREGI